MPNNNKHGVVPSKKDLRNYKINKKLLCGVDLPESFEVNHCTIKNQKAINSCVAHSTAEVFEAAIPGTKFSTDWIYGYRPLGYYQGEGMMISNALKTVTKLGAVKHEDLPTNTEIPKAKELVDSDLDRYKELASQTVAAKYARVFTVKDLKESIYLTGLPAVIAIQIDDDGLKLDDNYVAAVPDVNDGGHAVVCYGWSEKGLLIQNSWGKSWGNKGTFILPYDYKPTEMWTLTFEENKIVKPKTYWLAAIVEAVLKAIKGLFK